MKEIWKEIKDADYGYEISNLGNVRVLKLVAYKRNSKIKKMVYKNMKKSISKQGYEVVTLRKFRFSKTYKIHRLVAKAFLKNKDNLPQVNHKDENKLNNRVDNLEWCTAKYNNNYGARTDKVKNKLSKKINQCDLSGNIIKTFNSINDVAKEGFSISKVSEVCNNKYGRKTHKGFKWNFVDLLDNL